MKLSQELAAGLLSTFLFFAFEGESLVDAPPAEISELASSLLVPVRSEEKRRTINNGDKQRIVLTRKTDWSDESCGSDWREVKDAMLRRG